MGQVQNQHEKESKLWLAGMIAIIVSTVLLVVVAILAQHFQLSTEAAATLSSQTS